MREEGFAHELVFARNALGMLLPKGAQKTRAMLCWKAVGSIHPAPQARLRGQNSNSRVTWVAQSYHRIAGENFRMHGWITGNWQHCNEDGNRNHRSVSRDHAHIAYWDTPRSDVLRFRQAPELLRESELLHICCIWAVVDSQIAGVYHRSCIFGY